MQARNFGPPRHDARQISRRAALGGLVAAAGTAALADILSKPRPAAAQGAGPPLVPSGPAMARDHSSTTVLVDGRLLVAGGYVFSALSSVQIYDPVQGIWQEAAPMGTPRQQHAAALLPDGRVLVCGGIHIGTLSSAEIYDPQANTWTPAVEMPVPRCGHTATATGQGVIVTGGCYLEPLSVPALFDGASWRLL